MGFRGKSRKKGQVGKNPLGGFERESMESNFQACCLFRPQLHRQLVASASPISLGFRSCRTAGRDLSLATLFFTLSRIEFLSIAEKNHIKKFKNRLMRILPIEESDARLSVTLSD